ncbi:Scr1 family TA system antitoxin-like transcriptional regulator [Embleya sp. NPDC020886]|uniref:Scr1 family TA system antitoxin-like transcriptional regulator n=1 Tax=Embleya sp. NPDC020886 TaxID=3363980 RepID=UPI00379E54C8
MSEDSLWAVLRDAGADIDQCLDALWLARILPRPAAGDPSRADPRTPVSAPTEDDRIPQPADSTPTADDAEFAPLDARPDPPSAAGGLYPSVDPGGTDGVPAEPADVPVPRAIPHANELARALRPLRRTRPSAHTYVLDETATVDAAAETAMITAILRPAAEPWLDLTLVVDTGSSMVIWNRLTVELRRLLHRLGAFRRIKVTGLDTDETRPVLRTRPFAAGSGAAPAVEGDGLTLILTDGVGPAWHSGAAQRLMAPRALTGPLAILHTMPARLWDATGIRCTRLDVRAPGAAVANSLLSVHHPLLPAGSGLAGGKGDIAVPVLEFPAVSPRAWAELVAYGVDARSVPVTMFGTEVGTRLGDGGGAQAPLRPPASPEERIREFHGHASYEAFRLAGHFAAVAPLTLPLMRLVQHATGADTTPAHLAEVFASGLLVVHRSSPHGPEHTEYAFDSGVGERLLDTLSLADGQRTVEAVTRYVRRHGMGGARASALRAGHGNLHVLGPDARPFAVADLPLSRRLVGDPPPQPPHVESPEEPIHVERITPQKRAPATYARTLTRTLRRLRESHALTQRDVALEMDWSLSKLIRIETGQVNISTTDLRALLEAYQIEDEEQVTEWVELARRAKQRSWWYPYRDLISPEFKILLGYEGSATLIRTFEPHLVPALLATEEYTHEVYRFEGVAASAGMVELRMQRQERLVRPDGPRMHFVLDESVVRRMVGGPAVMRRQVARLRELAEWPNITVRVLPFTAGLYPRPRDAYELLTFTDECDGMVAYVESAGLGGVVRQEGEEDAPYPGPESYADVFRTVEDLADIRLSRALLADAGG